jgi:L-fuculose-phosphate aldolase
MDESQLREAICAIGRKLYQRRLVAAWDGNVSARLPDDRILCTPTMLCKGDVQPGDLAIVDLAGRQLVGDRPRTSEILLHLSIYRHRPDVNAVVHAHPPHATAFAVTGTPIPNGILPEVEVFLGCVPTAGYRLPGTAEFAESIVPLLRGTNTILLQNHGAVAFAESLDRAYGQMEILDAYCQILLLARALGPPRELTAEQIDELLALKRRLGFDDPRF